MYKYSINKAQKVVAILLLMLLAVFICVLAIASFSNSMAADDAENKQIKVDVPELEEDVVFMALKKTLPYNPNKEIPFDCSMEVEKPEIKTDFTEDETFIQTTELPMYETVSYSSPNEIKLTEEEAYRLAALVQAEADNLYECKTAIASLFLNRMYINQESFYDTLYRPQQFVTDWGTIAYADPQEDTIQAVYDVLANGITIPPYVAFYKIGGYHDWGDQVGWGIIGTTYFSYSQWQREMVEENMTKTIDK